MSTLKANSYQHVDRASPSITINSDGSVSIASTVTYEDVTSVDAVGMVTARSGLRATAGGLNVTAGISTFGDDVVFTGAAANVTWDKSTDDLLFNDNAKAIFGTSSDGLEIYHNGNNSIINDTGTGNLIIAGSVVHIKNGDSSESFAKFTNSSLISQVITFLNKELKILVVYPLLVPISTQTLSLYLSPKYDIKSFLNFNDVVFLSSVLSGILFRSSDI